jgi:hypothetical protein
MKPDSLFLLSPSLFSQFKSMIPIPLNPVYPDIPTPGTTWLQVALSPAVIITADMIQVRERERREGEEREKRGREEEGGREGEEEGGEREGGRGEGGESTTWLQVALSPAVIITADMIQVREKRGRGREEEGERTC